MTNRAVTLLCAVLLLGGAPPFLTAQTLPNRYIVILEDAPVAERFAVRESTQSAQANTYQRQIEVRQKTLKAELATRKIRVTGSVSTLLNAVFIVAPKARIEEIKGLAGVKAVLPQRQYTRDLNQATQLMNAPAAWNALGGISNAGAGVKIGILDTGIDQNHPAFQDSSLRTPPGYPVCSGSDCKFTSNKVIVARSYVSQLAVGSDPTNPALDSRPDDLSPRDRTGHGTAVASCAAGNSNTGVVTFNGMAPKAFLGNYRIYGSPEVNDWTSDAVIIQAVEDALNDGMDVVNFSSGGPAFSGPLDTGAACGNPAGVACDPVAAAFENAVKQGLIVVASAGNSGYDGYFNPTYQTIGSPADAPSVIAAGATTNGHTFGTTVRVEGAGVPSNLQSVLAQFGDSYFPVGATTGPLRDVKLVGDDGTACNALPFGSMAGALAFIQRGSCPFVTKALNAWDAGAAGVVIYMADSSAPFGPGGLSGIGIPVVMISLSDAQQLGAYIASNPLHLVSIDTAAYEVSSSSANQLTGWSSRGPTTGDAALKPDLIAVGDNVYMATQSYDPLGDMYSSNGYGVAAGTSFASPITAGAAALIKQKHPTFNPAQVKSVLVNNAVQDVTSDSDGYPVDTQSVGGGKLDAGAAVAATVTAAPATLSFGSLASGSLPVSKTFQLTNTGTVPLTLALAVAPGSMQSSATLALDQTSVTLAAGASATVKASLSGAAPASGTAYSGLVTIQGTGVSLRVPYLYFGAAGTVDNLIPLSGDFGDGTVDQQIPDGVLSIRLIDSAGLPVANAPVGWSARGGGRIGNVDSVTDGYGIAMAEAFNGSAPGTYLFNAIASGGLRYTFTNYARYVPAIVANGVVDGASFDGTKPIVPGSYVSILGANLSDYSDISPSATLPLAIDFVHVSFDVPSANISVPGRLVYVSSTQVNVFVPWELQGQTSAKVKVSINFTDGNVVTVALADASPSLFEISPGVVAALDINYKVINAQNPATHGQSISLFANGLGPVTNQPASGEVALVSPLSWTNTLAKVTIGGQDAPVSFSGLAPGFAGLYQINATVPAGLGLGTYPITVAIAGRTSNASNIAVQ